MSIGIVDKLEVIAVQHDKAKLCRKIGSWAAYHIVYLSRGDREGAFIQNAGHGVPIRLAVEIADIDLEVIHQLLERASQDSDLVMTGIFQLNVIVAGRDILRGFRQLLQRVCHTLEQNEGELAEQEQNDG